MKVILLVISIAFSSCAMSMDSFFEKENLVDAYLKNAKKGDALAQYVVASYYGISCSVECNLSKAIYWYQQSAENGYPYSANDLGILYQDIGELEKSVYWYEKAVELGYTPALVNLGLLYFREGPLYDSKASFKYFKEASYFNEYESLFHMGRAYKEGLGVDENYSLAFEWFKKSAEIGNPKAMRELGLMYKTGEGVSLNFDLAEQYLNQGAVLGDVESMHSLAVFYFGSPESHADFEKGLFYLQKAAMEGNALAASKIGLVYKKGVGVFANEEIGSLLVDKTIFD